MSEFPASFDAFELLRRLVFRGRLRNFNPELADELISAGFARIEMDALVATPTGITAERTLMRLPLPMAA